MNKKRVCKGLQALKGDAHETKVVVNIFLKLSVILYIILRIVIAKIGHHVCEQAAIFQK